MNQNHIKIGVGIIIKDGNKVLLGIDVKINKTHDEFMNQTLGVSHDESKNITKL